MASQASQSKASITVKFASDYTTLFCVVPAITSSLRYPRWPFVREIWTRLKLLRSTTTRYALQGPCWRVGAATTAHRRRVGTFHLDWCVVLQTHKHHCDFDKAREHKSEAAGAKRSERHPGVICFFRHCFACSVLRAHPAVQRQCHSHCVVYICSQRARHQRGSQEGRRWQGQLGQVRAVSRVVWHTGSSC